MDTLDLEPVKERGERVDCLVAAFQERFGRRPEVVVRVPGRVNLIGEHIDYCGYAVHPMAIEQDILAALGRRDNPGLQLANLDPRYEAWEGENLSELSSSPKWWGYFLCGVRGVQEEVGEIPGMSCMVDGTIPPSAGLSSSSAMVVTAAIASLWATNRLDMGREKLAGVCARAERFIGTQGGGMDQAIELLAMKGSAKLIEFGPLRSFDVQLPRGGVFVVANSLDEKNKAASNDYNTRVVECRLAARILAKKLLEGEGWKEGDRLKEIQEKVGVEVGQMVEKVDSVLHQEDFTLEEVLELLGVTLDWLQKNVLTPNTQHLTTFRLHQRAKHVYSEAARVYQFRDVCSSGQPSALTSLGDLMTASHDSCRDQYECSSSGLDTLVSLSKECGALGARLTGAGWGGCIVALVAEEKAETFVKELKERYYTSKGVAQEEASRAVFITGPGAGAQLWKV